MKSKATIQLFFKMAERRNTALQALDIFMNLKSSDASTGSDTS